MADDAKNTLTVMISSTARDLPDHRAQVKDACLMQGMLPKMMEHLPASDADAIKASLAMVDEADIYLGVFAFRYGHVPAGHSISITEMEYNRAVERSIPCLIFLMHQDHPLKAVDVEKGKGAGKLDAFKKRLSKPVVTFLKSPDDLRAHVVNALSQFRRIPSQEDLLKSQIRATLYRVAVINRSTAAEDEEVRKVVSALQTQIHRDFAPAWGIDAELIFVPHGSEPPQASWWLLLLDDADQPGALGYHDLTAEGLPIGKVFVKTSLKYVNSWTVTASHILLNLLANPRINLAIFRPSGEEQGGWYSLEVCTPCEAEQFAYRIDGTLVTDFVFPAWFEHFRKPKSTKFDYGDHIARPFELLAEGYALVFDRGSKGRSDFMLWSSQKNFEQAETKLRSKKKKGASGDV